MEVEVVYGDFLFELVVNFLLGVKGIFGDRIWNFLYCMYVLVGK